MSKKESKTKSEQNSLKNDIPSGAIPPEDFVDEVDPEVTQAEKDALAKAEKVESEIAKRKIELINIKAAEKKENAKKEAADKLEAELSAPDAGVIVLSGGTMIRLTEKELKPYMHTSSLTRELTLVFGDEGGTNFAIPSKLVVLAIKNKKVKERIVK